MKDLYKKYGLRELTGNRHMIEAELEKANTQDRQAGEYILLHKQRKSVYDRTFGNVKLIGQLRTELGLIDTDHWPRQRFSDFESSVDPGWASPGSSTNYGVPKPRQSGKDVNMFARFLGLVVFLIVLFVIFYDNKPGTNIKPETAQHKTAMYVTSNALNLRESPGTDSRVLDTLEKYQTLYADLGSDTRSWILVETDNGLQGYVSRKYLARGYGESAKISDCRKQGVVRPANGYMFKQQYTGPHQLVINNNPYSDVIVKLKSGNGDTVLAFYVRAGQSARISDVPEGYYQFFYATGSEYSPGCDQFLTDMEAFQDSKLTPYITERRGNMIAYAVQTYTLQRVSHGNFRPQKADVSQF